MLTTKNIPKIPGPMGPQFTKHYFNFKEKLQTRLEPGFASRLGGLQSSASSLCPMALHSQEHWVPKGFADHKVLHNCQFWLWLLLLTYVKEQTLEKEWVYFRKCPVLHNTIPLWGDNNHINSFPILKRLQLKSGIMWLRRRRYYLHAPWEQVMAIGK